MNTLAETIPDDPPRRRPPTPRRDFIMSRSFRHAAAIGRYVATTLARIIRRTIIAVALGALVASDLLGLSDRVIIATALALFTAITLGIVTELRHWSVPRARVRIAISAAVSLAVYSSLPIGGTPATSA